MQEVSNKIEFSSLIDCARVKDPFNIIDPKIRLCVKNKLLSITEQYLNNQYMSQRNTTSKIDQEAEERIFLSKFVQRQKKNQRKLKMLEGKNIGRWDHSEQTKYYIFLKMNEKFFENKGMRKNDKVFKIMSKFITTRTPDQCRSHHQKIQQKLPEIKQILSKLSQQFKGINVKQILQDYKTISFQTSDSNFFENQTHFEINQSLGLVNVSEDMLKTVPTENLEVLKKQQQDINQPFIVEPAIQMSFFHEEDIFSLMNF